MAQLTSGVRWIDVDDGMVVFVPSAAAFVDLDEAGAELFGLLVDVDWDLDFAAARLGARHDLTVDEARDVVVTFLASLGRYGMLSDGC